MDIAIKRITGLLVVAVMVIGLLAGCKTTGSITKDMLEGETNVVAEIEEVSKEYVTKIKSEVAEQVTEQVTELVTEPVVEEKPVYSYNDMPTENYAQINVNESNINSSNETVSNNVVSTTIETTIRQKGPKPAKYSVIQAFDFPNDFPKDGWHWYYCTYVWTPKSASWMGDKLTAIEWGVALRSYSDMDKIALEQQTIDNVKKLMLPAPSLEESKSMVKQGDDYFYIRYGAVNVYICTELN